MGSSARAAYLDVSNVEVCSRRIVNGVPTQLADSYIPESIDARGAAEIAPQEERHHDQPHPAGLTAQLDQLTAATTDAYRRLARPQFLSVADDRVSVLL